MQESGLILEAAAAAASAAHYTPDPWRNPGNLFKCRWCARRNKSPRLAGVSGSRLPTGALYLNNGFLNARARGSLFFWRNYTGYYELLPALTCNLPPCALCRARFVVVEGLKYLPLRVGLYCVCFDSRIRKKFVNYFYVISEGICFYLNDVENNKISGIKSHFADVIY